MPARSLFRVQEGRRLDAILLQIYNKKEAKKGRGRQQRDAIQKPFVCDMFLENFKEFNQNDFVNTTHRLESGYV